MQGSRRRSEDAAGVAAQQQSVQSRPVGRLVSRGVRLVQWLSGSVAVECVACRLVRCCGWDASVGRTSFTVTESAPQHSPALDSPTAHGTLTRCPFLKTTTLDVNHSRPQRPPRRRASFQDSPPKRRRTLHIRSANTQRPRGSSQSQAHKDAVQDKTCWLYYPQPTSCPWPRPPAASAGS